MANKKYKNPEKPFKWKHASGEIILWLVAWYYFRAIDKKGNTLDWMLSKLNLSKIYLELLPEN